MLDLDHGTYPFVTSSNPIAGAACVGAGVGPADIDEVWGVAKAYTTRVGAGPFPTELDDEMGAHIRERGGERGTTTGRDRRTGWLDLVALRYAARLNGLTALAMTKLDVLAGIDPLRVAVRYRSSEGALLDELPYHQSVLHAAEAEYEELPGFDAEIGDCRSEADLPPEARELPRVRRRADAACRFAWWGWPGPRAGDLDGRGRAPSSGGVGTLAPSRPTLDSRAMFEKVLVANRGEIAIRVMRTLEEMGIASVGVYSEADRDAPHVAEADEAFLLGPGDARRELPEHRAPARDGSRSRRSRRSTPATGSWPRTPSSPPPARRPGVVFIGPPASAIEAMGSKTRARELMADAGVPIVPGTTGARRERRRRQGGRRRDRLSGRLQGGGRGRRQGLSGRDPRRSSRTRSRGRRARARSSSPTRPSTWSATWRIRATSRSRCSPTRTATSIHLGERDCSIQRRHQKLIEEAPAPHVDEAMRERIGRIATDAAAAVGYRSAGTVEGLQDGEDYFFLEMNTRVQVEHCVTEMVTGIDIVREQVLIAAGEELSVSQEDVSSAATRSSAGSTPRPRTRTSPRRPGGSPPTASPPGPASASTRASGRVRGDSAV